MKTAMQEMFDKLNNVKPTQYCSIETIRGWAEFLLEIEKEQIVNAYNRRNEWFIQYDAEDSEKPPQIVRMLPVIPTFGFDFRF